MSWSFNKYYSYRRSSYRSNFYYSEKEIDFTNETLDYTQFLLQEFFTADLETRKKISKYYLENYGSRSFAYLKRKYSEWANGNYHLTDLMSGRILLIMPNFLNSEAKHKLGIHQFMSTIKKAVKNFESSQKIRYDRTKQISDSSELLRIFENEYNEIQDHSFDSLNLYGHQTDMLSDNEIIEAIEISKYILEVKLQKLYEQIERDFNIFLPFIQELKLGTFRSTFNITLFDIDVDIARFNLDDLEMPKFTISEIESNTNFKSYSDKYLAYEMVSIHKNSNEKVSDSFLNKNDLQLFLNHYTDLSKGDSEVKFDSTFIGESGNLMINARLVPAKIIKTSILYSIIKLFIYLTLTASLVGFAIIKEAFTILLFGGYFVGIIAYNFISKEIKELSILRKEYRTHGQ